MRTSLLDADRSWLALQPGMEDWASGCRLIVDQLDDWARKYSQECCAAAWIPPDRRADHAVAALWRCWGFHWQGAAQGADGGRADGWTVAERIMNGQSCNRTGARLGGNPLRDVVLVQAMLQRDKPAQVMFDIEYRDGALRLAASIDPRWRDDAGWWDALVERLIGSPERPGKLTKFGGRCSLRFWLATVVRRWLYDMPKILSLDPDRHVETTEGDAVADSLISAECFRLLTARLRSAVKKLQPAQVLVLALSFLDGLAGKQIAGMLGIAEGNVSRRRQKAVDDLLAELADPGGQHEPADGLYQTCLGHILAAPDRSAFAQAIARSLSEAKAAEVTR